MNYIYNIKASSSFAYGMRNHAEIAKSPLIIHVEDCSSDRDNK